MHPCPRPLSLSSRFQRPKPNAAVRARARCGSLSRRPSTAEDYERLLRLYIRPHLGRMRLSAVERADVERMLRDVTKVAGPYQSNRVHGVGSKLFSTAMRWSLLSPAQGNPFHGIERHKEHHRRRYDSAGEVRRLVVALAHQPDRQSADAIKLLLLTGARRGEVLSMRWTDVDLDAATWSRKAADRFPWARSFPPSQCCEV